MGKAIPKMTALTMVRTMPYPIRVDDGFFASSTDGLMVFCLSLLS